MRSTYICTFILPLLLCGSVLSYAQEPNSGRFRGGRYTGYSLEKGDTIFQVEIDPLYVFERPKNKKQYDRLVRNVKKVYPYAVEAREYMHTLETELAKIKSPREREKFISNMEKEIVRKYTPVLEKMTFSQGKILIKLIDRETRRTPYQILREFRGKFTAGFYNTIAKIFKADLKQHYDPLQGGEDAMIERIIILIEAGQL